jgi:hypothetical protein
LISNALTRLAPLFLGAAPEITYLPVRGRATVSE